MKVFLSFLLALFAVSSASADSFRLAPFGSTDKLLASQKGVLDEWKPLPVQLDCVRGEHANFQFVVSAKERPVHSLSIEPTPLATYDARFIPKGNLALFRENYVFVKHPSGNRIQTPKWWPDALVPLSLDSPTIEPKKSAVFWASLKVPSDAAPGDYFGELDVRANGEPKRLALTVHVRSLALPRVAFRGTAALYYDSVRAWYRKNGQAFSEEEWAQQKRRYAEFLLGYGLNPYDPPVAWNDPSIDDYLKDARVHSLRTPPLSSSDFPLALEAFKRTNTLAKAFYYWNDEPSTEADFAQVRADGQKLKAFSLPQLVTHHPTPALAGAVDIWCPSLSNALGSGHLDIPLLQQEQTKGRPTWLYTMVVPKHPYPTWLLDDDASAILSYAPLWSKVGATGCVYSMVHGWGPHPLDDLSSFQNTNGDGTLLYPAELVGGTGPMPSIRLLLIRAAIEDLGLWNAAKARGLAPQVSFPASRSGALVYPRRALLDALESGKKPVTRPDTQPQLWPRTPTDTRVALPIERVLGADRRVVVWRRGQELHVELRGRPLGPNETLVLALTPRTLGSRPVVTRYALDAKGKVEVSQRTDAPAPRAGALPPSPARTLSVKTNGPVRFNVLLRSPDAARRLFPDGGDPFLMPILEQ